jgi:hypothetical protein
MDGGAIWRNQECPEEKNSGVIEMRSVLSKLGCSLKLFVGANLTSCCTRQPAVTVCAKRKQRQPPAGEQHPR